MYPTKHPTKEILNDMSVKVPRHVFILYIITHVFVPCWLAVVHYDTPGASAAESYSQMTPTGGAEPGPEAETEPSGSGRGQSPLGGTAEGVSFEGAERPWYLRAEPDWERLRQVIGPALPLHVYGTGAAFLLIALVSLVHLVRTARMPSSLAKPYYLSLDALLVFSGSLRAVHFFVDAYNTKGLMPLWASHITLHALDPSLLSAFVLVFVTIVKVTRLRSVSGRLLHPALLAAIITLSYLVTFSADILVALMMSAAVYMFVCQLYFIVWGFTASLLYLYLFFRVYNRIFRTRIKINRLSRTRNELNLGYSGGVEQSEHLKDPENGGSDPEGNASHYLHDHPPNENDDSDKVSQTGDMSLVPPRGTDGTYSFSPQSQDVTQVTQDLSMNESDISEKFSQTITSGDSSFIPLSINRKYSFSLLSEHIEGHEEPEKDSAKVYSISSGQDSMDDKDVVPGTKEIKQGESEPTSPISTTQPGRRVPPPRHDIVEAKVPMAAKLALLSSCIFLVMSVCNVLLVITSAIRICEDGKGLQTPWYWFGYQTVMRCLEIGMATVIMVFGAMPIYSKSM